MKQMRSTVSQIRGLVTLKSAPSRIAATCVKFHSVWLLFSVWVIVIFIVSSVGLLCVLLAALTKNF